MKKILSIVILCFVFSQSANSEDKWELSEQFKTKLKSGAIFFVEPTVYVDNENMIEKRCYTLPVKENTVMNYDFAMHSKLANLEIRYIINLVDSGQAVDTAAYHSVIDNLSDTVLVPSKLLTVDGLKEINADWASTLVIKTKKEFKSAYKHAFLLIYRSDQKGWIYVIFSFDQFDESVQKELYNFENFYALKFR